MSVNLVDTPISLVSTRRIQKLNEEEFELRKEIEFHEEKIEEHQNKLKEIKENLEYNRIEKELYKKMIRYEKDSYKVINQKKKTRILSEKKLALKKALDNVFTEYECLNIREIMEKLKSHGIEWRTYPLAFQELTKSGFLIRQDRGMYGLNRE
ncbi:hypothetical protein B7C51_24560 (plasmid) [Paenibacillus larvae subsp. pulvifaciens]|uniref:Uncharacterized protein n=1 Tax=Paenibacillus larvae subsp. pulvifaciens TaxID=1477 RepID=A0A1V0V0C1_9BACL|nr:hypothetical protein [Paenibacillus larvae]ARF70801.1 hypothetical protein B7C51_24560 [Paenibacillus larvae subsp. pulvifaciens]